jgi:hypothetical protein
MMFKAWIKLATDTTLLALEAQTVIATRLTRAALGRSDAAENHLMITEKVIALVEATSTIATGGSTHLVVKGYRRRVRANIRRLNRNAR